MKAMTRKRAVILALDLLGYKLIPTRKTKYLVLEKGDRQILVGKKGAVRLVASDKPIGTSISLTDTKVHDALETLGRDAIIYRPKDLDAWVDGHARYLGLENFI